MPGILSATSTGSTGGAFAARPRRRDTPQDHEPTKGYGWNDEDPGFMGPPEPAPVYGGPSRPNPNPGPSPNPRPAPPPPPPPAPRGLAPASAGGTFDALLGALAPSTAGYQSPSAPVRGFLRGLRF